MQARCPGPLAMSHLTSSVKTEKRGVDFRFSQSCENAAEEDLRLSRDLGADYEGRPTTVT